MVLQRTIPNGKNYFCPNCTLNYEISSGSQEEVNKFAKKYYIQKIHEEVAFHEKEKSRLLRMINYAIKKDLSEEYNPFIKFRGSSIFPNKE